MPNDPTDQPVAGATVLEETPGRALTFLRGIANNGVIHAQLAEAGFTTDDYQQGWSLLHAASGYNEKPIAAPEKSAAFRAMTVLDAWDEDGFRRVRAALERLHPDQCAFVFSGGLAASTGAGAVLGVRTLLARFVELESGEERKATRKADHAAMKTLEGRGFTKTERARLQALVDTAQTLEEPAALPDASTPAARKDALVKLYGWYKDWSETARSVIKKRSHLITLGLAKRRTKKEEGPKPA